MPNTEKRMLTPHGGSLPRYMAVADRPALKANSQPGSTP